MQTNKPIPSQQLPQCQVCNLDPVPQSSQHILLTIFQIGLVFIDWKYSLILLMLGYSFPQTNWKCPFCSRQIDVDKQNNPSNSIFIRMGKCMALFSLNKFRIFAFAIVAWMLYLLVIDPLYNPKKHVTKNWQSMVRACGFQVYMENSVRSNKIYFNYLDSGYDWEFQAIYLNRQPTGIQDFQNIYFKMSPTQFKDPDASDFRAFTKKAVNINFERGDIVKLKGEWQGRQYYNFIFNPIQIINTGKKGDPSKVDFLYDRNSLLRSHLDAVKSQYEQEDKKEQIKKQGQHKKQQVKQERKAENKQQQAISAIIDDHIREQESKRITAKQTV